MSSPRDAGPALAEDGSRAHLGAALAASALLHGVVLLVALRSVPYLRPPSAPVPFPVALVDLPGGGGGAPAASPAVEAAPVSAPPPAAREPVARKPVPKKLAVRQSPRPPASPEATPGPSDGVADGGAADGGAARGAPAADVGGTGGGDGTGGDGAGGARVAYGSNPFPPYPLVARRLGKEGVVLLDVLVAADGRAADVRVVDSSGFAPLDEAAVTTVRQRWRFIPARRSGNPVESRVTVPIRFRLSDVRG